MGRPKFSRESAKSFVLTVQAAAPKRRILAGRRAAPGFDEVNSADQARNGPLRTQQASWLQVERNTAAMR